MDGLLIMPSTSACATMVFLWFFNSVRAVEDMSMTQGRLTVVASENLTANQRCNGGLDWPVDMVPAAPSLLGRCVVWPENCLELMRADTETLTQTPARGKLWVMVSRKSLRLARRKAKASARPVIFIHVGKTGGGTIADLLRHMPGGRFQIHSEQAGRFCTRRGVPGPVSTAMTAVPPLGKRNKIFVATVIWVRDPVSRVLSIWNSLGGAQGPDASLNEGLGARLKAKDGTKDNMVALEAVFEWFLAPAVVPDNWETLLVMATNISHGPTSLAWYVDDVALLDALPPLFVGRTEHMVRQRHHFFRGFFLALLLLLSPTPHLTHHRATYSTWCP